MTHPLVWADTTPVNSTTDGADSDVIALPDGGYIVAWQADEDIGAVTAWGTNLLFQRFDVLGQPVGNAFVLGAPSVFDLSQVSASVMPNGDVAFAYLQEAASSTELWVAVKDAGVHRVGFEHLDLPDGTVGAPTVFGTSDTGVSVVYQQQVGDVRSTMVTRLVDGHLTDPEVVIETANASPTSPMHTEVQTLSDGRSVVMARHYDGGDASIQMAFLDVDGWPLGAPTALPGTASNNRTEFEPVIAPSGAGFVAAWRSTSSTGDSEIYVQRFTATGQADSTLTRVGASSGRDFDSSPALTALQDGGFALVWREIENSTDSKLRLQRLDDSLNSVGSTVVVAQGPGVGRVKEPAIAALGDDRLVVSWTDTSGARSEVMTKIYRTIASDTIEGDIGDDILVGWYGQSTVLGDGPEGTPQGGHDLLYAHGIGDALYGQLGRDTLVSGPGNDTLDGGAALDTVDLRDATGGVTLDLSRDATVSAPGLGTDSLWSIEGIIGTDFDDHLIGTAGANVLDGGAGGHDTLEGLAGNDTLRASRDGSEMSGGAGADLLVGHRGNDRMQDGAGSDTLLGDDGFDTFRVSNAIGRDLFDGGLDTDLIDLALLPAGVRLDLGQGFDWGGIEKSVTNIENAWGTEHNDTLIGDGGDNLLNGQGGDDRIYGRAGDDTLLADTGAATLRGGLGDDTYGVYTDAPVRVIEDANGGYDRVFADASFALPDHVEELKLNELIPARLTGNDLDNTITGQTRNDTLDGGAGADTLVGQEGHDSYWVDHIGDQVVEYTGDGTDTVYASVGYTLGSAVEKLKLVGFANLSGFGNALDNDIRGNAGDNVLSGGEGDDAVYGLRGDDEFLLEPGADTLHGGNGNDVYWIDAADAVVEKANEGTDLVIAADSVSLLDLSPNIEDLRLAESAGHSEATGNHLPNRITGNSDNNVLDGARGNDTMLGGGGHDVFTFGPGADRMVGGPGDDTYSVNNHTDIVVEARGEGVDTVVARIQYSLESLPHVEHLVLDGPADVNARGNANDNFLNGNLGDNVLYGLQGDDTLAGGFSGRDTLVGGLGADTFHIDFGAPGVVVVRDYKPGVDRLTEPSDLLDPTEFAVRQSGDDVWIAYEGVDGALLRNVEVADVDLSHIDGF